MIVNPYKENKINESKNIPKTIDLNQVEKYLIKDCMTYLTSEDKYNLKNKIKQYFIEKFNILDEKIIELNSDVILNKMFGYGILHKYIIDENISDIRVVAYNSIYVKQNGKWIKSSSTFSGNSEFNEYIKYCIVKNNHNINFDLPIVIISDKKYNLRIEAGIAPVNSMSSSLVIRIHRENNNLSLEKLMLEKNMLSTKMYLFLDKCINLRKNIAICGKGGSGKTTLLRALINRIPEEIPITVNEETTELNLSKRNVIQREVLENREENKKINLEKLTKHSLVMSNDIIVIGEIKGSEALIFFDSISTGHMGLTTLHSDSAYNAIDRLVTLIKRNERAQNYTENFVLKLLSNSLQYIIFMRDYKIEDILKVNYNKELEKVEYIKFENIQSEVQ